MWPFKKQRIVTAKLQAGAYRRWLRAQRPPFEWFIGQTEDHQEWMASLGDEYVRGVAVEVGEESRADQEEKALRQLAAASAGQLLGSNGGKPMGWPPGAQRRAVPAKAPAPVASDEGAD